MGQCPLGHTIYGRIDTPDITEELCCRSEDFEEQYCIFLTFSFEGKEQGESCEGSISVRSVEESETSAYLIHHHIVKINQLIILLPLLLAILKICLSLALLHITQLLILLLCLSLVFLNITTQMGGLCRTRVHYGVV